MSGDPRKKQEEAILILQNQLQAGVKSCPELSSQKSLCQGGSGKVDRVASG